MTGKNSLKAQVLQRCARGCVPYERGSFYQRPQLLSCHALLHSTLLVMPAHVRGSC